MPLFGHKRAASPAAAAPAPTTTAAANEPANTGRGGSIFGRNRHENVDNTNANMNSAGPGYNNGYNLNNANANQMGNGANGYDEPRRSTGSGSFFSRSSRNGSMDSNNTPSSLNEAHGKLDAAVASERAADAALRDARLAVRDARDMVDRIEREARREADMANAKLKEARTMRKTAGGLGKFGTA